MLIIMCGLPGTGKTTAAEHLAPITRARLLSTDGVRREMFRYSSLQEVLASSDPLQFDLQRIFDVQPSIPEKYQQLIWKQNEMVYEEMLKRTSALLSQGSVILDGTFSKKRIRERAYAIASNARQKSYLIFCVCSEEEIRQRLERVRDLTTTLSDVAKMEIYYKFKPTFEEPLGDNAPVIIYDSEKSNVDIRNAQLGDLSQIAQIERTLRSIVVRRT